MNVASLELSRELYQVSSGAWHDTEYVWCSYSDDGGKSVKYQVEKHIGQPYEWAALDLGYLLRKLPHHIISGFYLSMLVGEPEESGYGFGYFAYGEPEYFYQKADTPEDAAAKLTIELFKQGILTRGES